MLWRNFCKFVRSLPLLEKQWFWFFPTIRPRQVWLPSHCRQIPVQCSQTRRSRHHYALWKTQTMTKYLHKATSFYTEASRYLMITRKGSLTWRFLKVPSDWINFSWNPFTGLSFVEKGSLSYRKGSTGPHWPISHPQKKIVAWRRDGGDVNVRG